MAAHRDELRRLYFDAADGNSDCPDVVVGSGHIYRAMGGDIPDSWLDFTVVVSLEHPLIVLDDNGRVLNGG